MDSGQGIRRTKAQIDASAPLVSFSGAFQCRAQDQRFAMFCGRRRIGNEPRREPCCWRWLGRQASATSLTAIEAWLPWSSLTRAQAAAVG